jgi:hypothetical protein
MLTSPDIDYSDQRECKYKNEKYSVRDNGAIFRHSPNSKKARPKDNHWTFGKKNLKTGYLEIVSIPVHRIIATAFHGEPPSKDYVVDHIDTNRQNNRPENLRWVTRLENLILNPITLKRIISICGSVEAFLSDPSKFKDKFQNPSLDWMCTVTKNEAQISKERLINWSKSEKTASGGSIGDWIFNRQIPNESVEEIPLITESLTSNAWQANWKTPSMFPLCPQGQMSFSLDEYANNLSTEAVFSENKYAKSIVEDFAFIDNNNALLILCRSSEPDAIKQHQLAKVTLENNCYIHSNLGSFFTKDGAQKEFTLAQGLEWTGGDTLDDYC